MFDDMLHVDVSGMGVVGWWRYSESQMVEIGKVLRNARIRLSSKVRLGCDDMEKIKIL